MTTHALLGLMSAILVPTSTLLCHARKAVNTQHTCPLNSTGGAGKHKTVSRPVQLPAEPSFTAQPQRIDERARTPSVQRCRGWMAPDGPAQQPSKCKGYQHPFIQTARDCCSTGSRCPKGLEEHVAVEHLTATQQHTHGLLLPLGWALLVPLVHSLHAAAGSSAASKQDVIVSASYCLADNKQQGRNRLTTLCLGMDARHEPGRCLESLTTPVNKALGQYSDDDDFDR